jgi:hypothetical protein
MNETMCSIGRIDIAYNWLLHPTRACGARGRAQRWVCESLPTSWSLMRWSVDYQSGEFLRSSTRSVRVCQIRATRCVKNVP